jgi:hypothetical protein
MDVTIPIKLQCFGTLDVTKPYKFIRFGAMDVTKTYEIYTLCCHGCHQTLSIDRAMDVTNPINSYALGPWMPPNPIKFIGPWMSPNPINLYALVPWMSPNPNKFRRFGAMDVAKPYT